MRFGQHSTSKFCGQGAYLVTNLGQPKLATRIRGRWYKRIASRMALNCVEFVVGLS